MSFWEFIGMTTLFDFLFDRKMTHLSRRNLDRQAELEDRYDDIYAQIDELESRLDECDIDSDIDSDLSDEIEELYDELADIEYEQLLIDEEDNRY